MRQYITGNWLFEFLSHLEVAVNRLLFSTYCCCLYCVQAGFLYGALCWSSVREVWVGGGEACGSRRRDRVMVITLTWWCNECIYSPICPSLTLTISDQTNDWILMPLSWLQSWPFTTFCLWHFQHMVLFFFRWRLFICFLWLETVVHVELIWIYVACPKKRAEGTVLSTS